MSIVSQPSYLEEWSLLLGAHCSERVVKRKVPVNWSAVKDECVSSHMWFGDHDALLWECLNTPMQVTCGCVTVNSSEAQEQLAVHISILLHALAAAHGHPSKVEVFLIPSAEKRRFPTASEAIERVHVNGGYCIPGDVPRIVLVRAEECLKVAVHELTHVHLRRSWPKDAEESIRSAFHMCDEGACEDPVAPFETIVELKAQALCCAFIAFFSGSHALAARVWSREQEWAKKQARRVVHVWNGSQHTSLLEYVVLRSVLMDDDFENVRALSNDDSYARSITRKAVALALGIKGERHEGGGSLRFTCEIPEVLENSINQYLWSRARSL